jgi:thymidylate synthase (FAD)
LNVELIAHTAVARWNMEDVTDGKWYFPMNTEGMDALGEFAGRACYQSWGRPNPATAENADYLKNVIDQGHESVLAHASATFYVQGVSRSLTHELIRHRWLAFSELSQRYVDMEDAEYVVPPNLAKYGEGEDGTTLAMAWESAVDDYKYLAARMEARGFSRKKAREAARAVLPGMTETKIVVSGNLRAWRDFLKQRLTPHADAEICAFAREVFKHLTRVAPNSMYGIEDFE